MSIYPNSLGALQYFNVLLVYAYRVFDILLKKEGNFIDIIKFIAIN